MERFNSCTGRGYLSVILKGKIWKMSGHDENGENIETYVQADSFDDAIHKARAVYGYGITGGQIAE